VEQCRLPTDTGLIHRRARIRSVGINQFRQIIEPAAEQVQHRRHVVFGNATGIKKELDANTEVQRTSLTKW